MSGPVRLASSLIWLPVILFGLAQVDVAGVATVARQVGVVKYVVVEPISRESVAFVVGLVERPVVAQTLGCQHQHAVVA